MKKIYFIALVILTAFAGCKKEEVDYTNNIIVGWGDGLTWGVGGNDTTYLTSLSKLTGIRTYNMGVFTETSTQIKARMIADTPLHKYPTIIWAGRLNTWQREKIITDIADMVASLGHKKFLVLGLINADNNNEYKGTEQYQRIITINNQLAQVYGDHFVDVRTYLISQYDKSSVSDTKDHDLDVVPGSQRSSILNLNAKGYKLVAGEVNTKINVLRDDR